MSLTWVTEGQIPSGCPVGYTRVDGFCVQQVKCPPGYTFYNGKCLPALPQPCPPGMVAIGGKCGFPLPCSPGFVFLNGKCVVSPCPPGKQLNRQGQCV